MRRFSRGLLACALVVAFGASCSSSKKLSSGGAQPRLRWPAPADAMQLARDAGLVPETAERLQYHVHAHLDVFIDGKPVIVPGGIGINIHDPAVHSGVTDGQPAYGGINTPCDQPCISPLHTHDATGVLHTESATRKSNTLGEFFTEWGVKLDPNCVGEYCKPKTDVAVYVDGKKFDGDPRTVELADGREIAIVIGTPPAQIPSKWSP
jgi:hypothetical protein